MLILVGYIFYHSGSHALYQVNPNSGALRNIEVMPDAPSDVAPFLAAHGRCFQGGNAQVLHRLLGLPSGDRLLYVGDHIFSDVVRSKRTLGWRTCLIVPELSAELQTYRYGKEHTDCSRLCTKKVTIACSY